METEPSVTPLLLGYRVLLGYRAKKPWRPQETWLEGASRDVSLVCSVSEHLAEFAPEPDDRWELNGALLLDHEAVAASRVPPDEVAEYRVFAYGLVPLKLGPNGDEEPVAVGEILTPNGTAPTPALAESYTRLGFDVVNSDGRGFECSPLSCNLMSKEVRVNPFCLIDSLTEALEVCWRFDREEPEPGPYYVVEVLVKRALS